MKEIECGVKGSWRYAKGRPLCSLILMLFILFSFILPIMSTIKGGEESAKRTQSPQSIALKHITNKLLALLSKTQRG